MTRPVDRDQAHRQLRSKLEVTVARLAGARSRLAAKAGFATGVAMMPKLGLGLALGFFGASFVAGGPPFAPWWLPVCLLAVPPAAALALFLAQRRLSVDDDEAAVLWDAQHQTRDRISAALELSLDEPHQDRTSGFADAAIEDGVALAQERDLAAVTEPSTAPSPSLRLALLGILLALVPAIVPAPAAPGTAPRAPDSQDPLARAGTRGEEAERPATSRPEPRAAAQHTPAANSASVPRALAGETTTGRPDATRTPRSATGEGGGGQGAPSEGAGESEPTATPPSKPAKTTPKPPPGSKPPGDPESSSTPGGIARGAGRPPSTANKRAGTERGVPREDDPEVEDEPLDDEKQESEQRGGTMPLSRDRDRPTARELSISGKGPPDDGRGGPSPQKKNRGTASLVLGVTLPDHVRGQPNPGAAKTSVVARPPRAEPGAPGRAEAAAPGGAAHVLSHERPSVLELVVRRFHELLRTNPGDR